MEYPVSIEGLEGHQLVVVSVQDIVNSFERTFYLDEDSGHREHCQAV